MRNKAANVPLSMVKLISQEADCERQKKQTLRRGEAMVSPFNLKTALLAKHAQHVVLIHFPIGLYSCGSSVRPHSTLDEAPWPRRCGVLQLARGGNFNASRSRHRATRVAVSTRGPETEGDPIAALSTCVRLERPDLAGVVGAFPCSAAVSVPAKLPSGR
jgi:hypothetical protein